VFPLRHPATIRIVLVVVVLGTLGLAVWQIEPSAVLRAFAGMSWTWGAAAALLNLLSLVVDAWRWRLIVNARCRVPLVHAFRALLAGVIGNLVMPLKLGDGARTLLLSRSDAISPATALTTVVLDRAIDSLMLPLFLGLASVVLPLPPAILRYRPLMLAGVTAVALAFVVAGRWIRRQPVCDDGLSTGRPFERVFAGLAALGHAHRLAAVAAVALLSWTLRGAVIWCMCEAFHLQVPPAAAVATLAAIYLGGAISPTPGNLASFELAAAGALAVFGVAADTGLSLGIATHALEIVPTLLLGLMMGIVPRRPVTLTPGAPPPDAANA